MNQLSYDDKINMFEDNTNNLLSTNSSFNYENNKAVGDFSKKSVENPDSHGSQPNNANDSNIVFYKNHRS